MHVLVTGAAGFIGFHVAAALLSRGDEVVGLDSLTDYYDPALKRARLAELERLAGRAGARFRFIRADLADRDAVEAAFAEGPFDRVVHFAAQAGVRYSLERPEAYVTSNLVGFANLLDACRLAATPHLVFASSSSVYGGSEAMPYSEHQAAVHPIQLYAATKRANELMAHSYAHLYGLPATALRLFTVYGPWGRPDMALFEFTRAIIEGDAISLSNHGVHERDFTFIDDAVASVLKVVDGIAMADQDWQASAPDPATAFAPFEVFNIASGKPVRLLDLVAAVERAVGKSARKELIERSPADMIATHADITRLVTRFGEPPLTPLDEGVTRFVAWYRTYRGL